MFLCIVALCATSAVNAATVVVNQGALIMNLDRVVWASLNGGDISAPGLYLEEYFDQATAAALPASELGTAQIVAGNGEIPATGLVFALNGAVVDNLPQHHAQPTNFSFDPAGLPASAQGLVGLGGALRFRGNFGSGFFAIGEFGLRFDASRSVFGASGWVIENNVTFNMPTFDLIDVVLSADARTLALTGSLRLAPEAAAVFFAPADATKVLGDVALEVSAVPLPAGAPLFGVGLIALGLSSRRLRATPRALRG
jgi:hypothetical protein